MTSPVETRELARRRLDLSWNKRDIPALDGIWSEDAVLHLPGGQSVRGANSIKSYLDANVGAYTDRDLTIDEIVADGDVVAVRWSFRGTQVASSRPVSVTGMDFYRLVDGLIVEEWFEANLLGLMQQLNTEAK